MGEFRQEEQRENTREAKEVKRLETRVSRIAAMRSRSETVDDLIGYVYREKADGESRKTAGKIRKVLDDYEFGVRFGPGDFFVVYNFHLADGFEDSTSIRYSTGPEFADLYKSHCLENGLPYVDYTGAQNARQGGGVLDLLDRGRVEALAGLAGLAKQVFNPGNQGEQLAAQNLKLMELLAARSNAGGLSDQIVIESIKSMRSAAAPAALPAPASPRETLREQIDFLKDLAEVRDLASPKQEKEDAGPMQFFVEKALELLPDILQKYNGNETKAAQALKQQNIFVRSMMKKPDVQKTFYRAAVENYGPESAARWARGFGLDPAAIAQQINPAQSAPAPVARAGVVNL